MASAVKIFDHFETPKKVGVYFRLVCLTGDNKGKAYFLMGKRIVLGRSENCDVTVLDLKSSREHAEIIEVGANYILTDLSSQNGIVVNDLKIRQHTLTNGDKIIIGKTVYKFSKVEVKETKKNVENKLKLTENVDDEFYDDLPVDEPKNKKLTMILSVIIVLAVLLLLADDDPVEKRKIIQKKIVKIAKINMPPMLGKNKARYKKNKEKLVKYLDQGRREYREGNYFRSISQFESALQILPGDSFTNFYLRKAREKLDEQIEGFFSMATRDIDSVSYMKAKTSYCAVIRLLNRYQTDPRFLTAKEGIRSIEKKMGMEEGEIYCIEPARDGS